jgi:hypothetical protein
MFLVDHISSYSISGTPSESWAEIRFSLPVTYHDFSNFSILLFNKELLLTEMLTSENPMIRQFALDCLEQAKAYIEKNETWKTE